MLSEIGSNHWFDINAIDGNVNITPSIYGFKASDYAWLSSGRGAIAFVIDKIYKDNPELSKIALLPPYTCHTVFNPFYDAGLQVESYSIDEHFTVTKEDVLKRVDEINPGIVLFQRYFGFETLQDKDELISVLRNRNIITIEDCTQTLFSDIGYLDVDYHIASVRKFFGITDGGFAICRQGKFDKSLLKDVDKEREAKIINASLLKNNYINDNNGDKKEFLDLFYETEEKLEEDKTLRRISDIALKIQSCIDFVSLKKKRKDNYLFLMNELINCEGIDIIFKQLNDNEVPLYMPIYIKGCRTDFQSFLKESAIYAPIVWPKPDRTPRICKVAEDFYSKLICLPIDQRYDFDDMKRMANRIKMFLKTPLLAPDIFYTKEWLQLYKEVDGENSECDLYTFIHPHGNILYPLVLRKSPDNVHYDTITPRGFCGPIVVDKKKDDLKDLIDGFDKDFKQYCLTKNIVTEYVRFCSWERNDILFNDLYNMRYNNQTVAIDLRANDILMEEISSKRRNQIRSAMKKGVKVRFDFNGETVEEFYRLYQNTIEKNDIGSDYDFSLDFLKKHFEYLKGNCWIANAYYEDRIISSAFVLMWNDNMHYHLSANDYSMNIYNGNSLLLYEIAKLGKKFGCKYLHLGGIGVGKKSLMDFKLSFTKKCIFDFYVGSRIDNQEIYDELVKKYCDHDTGYFPAYRG